jgi:hypothetical protein
MVPARHRARSKTPAHSTTRVSERHRLREKIISVKGAQIDPWYAGKTHDFGGNVQVLSEPGGLPVWSSDVEPGGVVDIDAARTHVLPAVYPTAARLPILADPGYQGAGHGVHTPFKQPADGSELAVDNRAYNALLRALRSLGERGFALLTQRWTTLQHITLSPGRIGDLVRAALVLTHFEYGRIS